MSGTLPTLTACGSGPRYRAPNGQTYDFSDLDRDLVGVTTAINLMDKPALLPAAARLIAAEAWRELADRPHRFTDEADAISYLSGSARRNWRAKADRGSDVHRAIETGKRPKSPFAEGCFQAALNWQRDRVAETYAAEATLRDSDAGYAGTADLLARLHDGRYGVADYKTGKSVGYIEQALQLVALSRTAELVLDDGTVKPLLARPKVGIVVHLKPDASYGEYRLDLTGETADRLYAMFFALVDAWYGRTWWGQAGHWDAEAAVP